MAEIKISEEQINGFKGQNPFSGGYVMNQGVLIDDRFIFHDIEKRNEMVSAKLAVGLTCYVACATPDTVNGGYKEPGAYYVLTDTPELYAINNPGMKKTIDECWQQIAFGTSTTDAVTSWTDDENIIDGPETV